MKNKQITTITDLLFICDLFKKENIIFWIDGGWGVDILAGKQTREHRDIDVNFDAKKIDKLLELLFNNGYKIYIDLRPTRIELYSEKYGFLDIHPFIINEDGTSMQSNLEGGWYCFPKDFFDEVLFEKQLIPCISVKGQIVFHSGYELREKDKLDLLILNKLKK